MSECSHNDHSRMPATQVKKLSLTMTAEALLRAAVSHHGRPHSSPVRKCKFTLLHRHQN